jgi:valyl-tRNA synthetase
MVVESEVDALVELVRGIRNARSEAHVEPASWLPVGVALPVALGPTFEALRPAIERLARARPLERHLTREALHAAMATGGLAVIARDIEAVVAVGGGDRRSADAGADRARLERELAEAEGHLTAARARLANEAFTAKAPPAVVEGARAREAELADQVARLRSRLDG